MTASRLTPAGVATTAATFDFGYADSKGGGADSAFDDFDVSRVPTGAVLNTCGSSASPVSCNTASSFVTNHTSLLTDVPSTDIANDPRIRVCTKEAAKVANWVDLATVTVTTANATHG